MAANSRIAVVVQLVDKASRNAQKIEQKLHEVGDTGKEALKKTGNESKSTTAQIRGLDDATGGLVRRFTRLRQIVAGGLVALGLGNAIQETLEYSRALGEVSTLVDSAQHSNEALSATILGLSESYGMMPVETARGLYQSISAGAAAGAEANELLEVAMRTAIGGVTTVDVAVNGLTTVMNAWGDEAGDAAHVADVLFTTMKNGKTTIGELSSFIFQAAPLASSLGVSFESVMATMIGMTKQGTPTSVAMTAIRAAMQAMLQKSKELNPVFMKATGHTVEWTLKNRGLKESLDLVYEASGGSSENMIKLLGNIEGMNAIMQLTGDKAGIFAQALDDISNAGGAAAEAYDKMRKSLGKRFDVLVASVTTAMIRLGTVLEPIIGPLMDVFAQVMQNLSAVLEVLIVVTHALSDFIGEWPVLKEYMALVIPLLVTFKVTMFAWKLVIPAVSRLLLVLMANLRYFGTAATVAAAKARALSAVMALMGGPAGVIALVAVGLGMVAKNAYDSHKALNKTRDAHKKLQKVLEQGEGVTATAIEQAKELAKAELKTAQSALLAAKARLASAKITASQTNYGQGKVIQHQAAVDSLNAEIAKIEKALEDADKKLEELAKKGLGDDDAGGTTQIGTLAAQIEADKVLALAQLARARKELKAAFEAHKISIREFFTQDTTLQGMEIDIKVNAVKGQLKDKNLTEEQRVRLMAQLNQLEIERAGILADNARKEQEAIDKLKGKTDEMKEELRDLQGVPITFELAREEALADWRKLRAELVAEEDEKTLIQLDELIDQQAAQRTFDSVKERYETLLEELADARQQYDDNIASGMDQGEAMEGLVQATASFKVQVQDLVPVLERMAEVIKDPEAKAALEALKREYEEITTTVDEYGQAINDGIGNSMETMFQGLIDGTKNADEAFAELGQNIKKMFMDLLAQKFAEKLFNGLMGSGSTMGALFNWKDGGYIGPAHKDGGQVQASPTQKVVTLVRRIREQHFADGGVVRGPGSGTSDSIQTAVPVGSYIIKAAAVRKYGADKLQQMANTVQAVRKGVRVPVRLSNGEFQFGPSAVSRYGRGLLEAINQMKLDPDALMDLLIGQRFADGGMVSPRTQMQVAGLYAGGGTVAASGKQGGQQAQTPLNLNIDPELANMTMRDILEREFAHIFANR